MSKQSNQRYRKEKEKEHLEKAGISSSGNATINRTKKQNKLNGECNISSNGLDR